MVMCIASVANGFSDGTFDALAELGSKNNWPVYNLINENIHGIDRSYNSYYQRQAILNNSKDMLLAASKFGIESPVPGIDESLWGADNRFLRSLQEQREGRSDTQDRKYNGLDFMLLHNLYWLSNNEKWVDPLQQEGIPSDASIKLFPNPLRNKMLFINLSKGVNADALIRIDDLYGRNVYKERIRFFGDTYPLLVPASAEGLYVVTLIAGDTELSELLVYPQRIILRYQDFS